MGHWRAVSLPPAADAPPLLAREAGHSGALYDLPSVTPRGAIYNQRGHGPAASDKTTTGRERSTELAGKPQEQPTSFPADPGSPAAPRRFPSAASPLSPQLSPILQNGRETPQPPHGGLGGGGGSPGRKLSAGALQGVHGLAAADL